MTTTKKNIHHSRYTAEEIISKMKAGDMANTALSKVKASDLAEIYAIYKSNDNLFDMITNAYLLGFYKGSKSRK